MLERMRVFGWLVEVDTAATAAAQGEASEPCSCAYCRNYSAAHGTLPSEVLETLRGLGVDPSEPAEAVEYCANADGTHLYEVWYHVVGVVIEVPTEGLDRYGRVELGEGVEVGLSARCDIVPEHFPKPVLQINVWAHIPWVIGEGPD